MPGEVEDRQRSSSSRELKARVLVKIAVKALLITACLAIGLFILLPLYLSSFSVFSILWPTSSKQDVIVQLIAGFSLYSIIGVILALARRSNASKMARQRSIAGILLKDYCFTESAALRLITFEYAIVQGLCTGIVVATIPSIIYASANTSYMVNPAQYFGLILASIPAALLFLVLVRILLEKGALRIRERQEAINYYIAASNRINELATDPTATGAESPNLELPMR